VRRNIIAAAYFAERVKSPVLAGRRSPPVAPDERSILEVRRHLSKVKVAAHQVDLTTPRKTLQRQIDETGCFKMGMTPRF
jgi:hypothetical protein